MDAANNFACVDPAAIYRHRIFGGAKIPYDMVQFAREASCALARSSIEDRANTSMPAPSPHTAM